LAPRFFRTLRALRPSQFRLASSAIWWSAGSTSARLVPSDPIIPGNPIFTGRFIPGNPISPISFSFSGHSGAVPAFAFANNVDLATLNLATILLQGPPILPLPIFEVTGPPIRVSGLIVGFDDPEVIGTWDITIQAATPLPGALAMFSGGLGVLGLLGWRRKRKALAAWSKHLIWNRERPPRGGLSLCAEHDRQLGGGSPLSSLMVVKD
jgi:hypothetical protein